MIFVNNLSKQYGEQILFEELNFSVTAGERLGIVGRNGHGKTTLIKMITGIETIDEGEIVVPRDYRVGHLSQIISFTQDTILKEGCQALAPDEAESQWRVEKILSGLGFSVSDFERHPDEFSGGYQMRLNLAKLLIAQPDLLLLDEPTNFLDIISIRWLVTFLKKWPGEIILISHNRAFMDSIVTTIMGIHRKKAVKIKGKTEDYYEKILIDEENQEKERINLEKKKALAQQYIDKYRAKARRASQVQSRIKAMEKLGTIEKLHRIKDLSFKFNEIPMRGHYCLEARNLCFSYSGEGPYLINQFSLTVSARDRIAIIGKNGQGKTTLMNLLAGRLQPVSGYVKVQNQCHKAHFVQANVAELNDELSVVDEILSARDDGDKNLARRTCGIMMFSKNMALKKIGVLSGGEKCRVLLGKLLGTSANCLLLDEPTHHLDMQSCQAMIDAINNFNGATVIITHDEHVLRSVANRLVVFQNDSIFVYEGNYDDFLKEVGWQEEGESPKASGLITKKLSKKEMRKLRSDFNARRRFVMDPLEKKMKDIEDEIAQEEKLLDEANVRMIALSGNQDQTTMGELAKSIGLLQKKIKEYYEELEMVMDELTEAQSQFDEEEKKFFL